MIMSGLKFICSGKTDEFRLYMGVVAVGVFSARSGEFIRSEEGAMAES